MLVCGKTRKLIPEVSLSKLPIYRTSCCGPSVGHHQVPEVIKLFSCSTQLSMKFFLLINVKMPTIVGILTFMSRKIAF